MKNMIYDIDGVSKDFLSWCKEFNQRPEIVQSRMSLGLALDEALRVATSNKELLFNINGEIRPLQHWSRIYCINYSTILSRIQHGYSYEDAITQPLQKNVTTNKRYLVNGKNYTLPELGTVFKINQSTIKNRLRAGETLYEALDTVSSNRRRVREKDNPLSQYALYTYDGRTMTLIEWCREKKIAMTTMKKRLQNGHSFEDAISSGGYIGANKYDVDGKQMTLIEIEKEYGISARLLYKRIHELGYSVHDAIHTVNDPTYHLFDGEYLTVPQISKKTGINKITLYARLKKGMPIEAATSIPVIKRGTLYDIGGEQMTLVQISEKYGISYSRLHHKVVMENIPIEEAINTKRARTFCINGETRTIAQLSEKYGVKAQTIRQRLRNGNNIEEALQLTTK